MTEPVRLACAVLFLTLSACATHSPNLDAQMGRSVAAARTQQTIKPAASANRDPVAGIDGNAANDAIDNYADSYKTPPPPVINVFGINR